MRRLLHGTKPATISKRSSRVNFQGYLQTFNRIFQIIPVEHVGNPDLVMADAGGRIKAGSRSHHNSSTLVFKFFQHPLAETVAVVDRQPDRISENVVMIDSVSKRFSACGIRIGSLVSKNKMVIKSIAKLAMARLCPPMLGQVVAESAVDSPPEYMADVYRE